MVTGAGASFAIAILGLRVLIGADTALRVGKRRGQACGLLVGREQIMSDVLDKDTLALVGMSVISTSANDSGRHGNEGGGVGR
jgi:hypothetical protein